MKLFKHRPTEGYQTKISIINRRKAILTTAKYTFFGFIGLRLLWLQVFQSKKYSILSDRNRFKEWKIAAERGLILDRFNNRIAENRQLYRIALIKGDVTDLDFVLLTLNKFLRLDNEIIEKTRVDFTKSVLVFSIVSLSNRKNLFNVPRTKSRSVTSPLISAIL